MNRRTGIISLLLLVLSMATCIRAAEPAYPDRFVWVFGWNLSKDGDVEQITRVLETGAKHGINGAVLSAGLDGLSRQKPEYFKRLQEVQQACERLKIELIPAVFSVGYGGSALRYNRMLAEGVPVTDAPMVVKGNEALLAPDASVTVANGAFEDFSGNKFKAWRFHDQPGEISFADTEVKRSGKASIRFENFTANKAGHGRIMQEVRLRPHRCYRITVWVRTQDLKPAGSFKVMALVNNRELAPRQFDIPATSDWRKVTMLVNSMEFETVRLYAGVWGGKEGKFWIDDWTIEEVGPMNVLRRPGTPVTIRSEDGATTFEEGKDYAPLEDPKFSAYNIDRAAVPLKIIPGGRIGDGQKVLASWYHPMVVHSSQVTVCMAEPQLYEHFDEEAKLLAQHVKPRRVMLNMDEVRMGGTCRACGGRDMARLLGECVTKQAQAIQKHSPGAKVYIWSDMLDPHHNAHDNYYLVKGSFEGSWKHVPRDLVISIWGGPPREKSLEFFAKEGFASIVACYYDAENLDHVKAWLQATRGMSNIRGFMYTPWQRKYELLGEFGELLK